MTDERITVSFNEEEFDRNVVAELIQSDFVKEYIKADPMYLLTLPIIGREIWVLIEKYSRMQKVADMITNGKEN
jgi:hypothetical protein